jgi:hypothetical protein
MDFRHVVDWLRAEWYACAMRKEKTLPADSVRGVRINRYGDTYISKRPAYEACLVPSNFFGQDRPLDVPMSRAIGIPLLAFQLTEPLPWKNRRISGTIKYRMNLTSMKVNPAQARLSTSTVLLFREARKVLLAPRMEDLVKYLKREGRMSRRGCLM